MNTRAIAALLLVAGLLVPAAAAMPTTQDAPTHDRPTQQTTQTATTTENSGGRSDTSATNYTRLYVEDRYRSVELKPGQSASFDVTVENGEDHDVSLSPHLYVPRMGGQPVERGWVSIESGDTTLAPDEERTLTVTVTVPEGTELGRYRGAIAFTNETVSYPGRPPRPVHSASFTVQVYKEPTVRIVEGDYAHVRIQAGESYTHSIVVENSGDSAVPVNPKLADRNSMARVVMVGASEETSLRRSWIEIDAPSEIPPGETATINVTVSPPADAAVGSYDLEIDLGLKDPARPDRSDYWQRVDLGVQVWKQPDEPFTTTVQVTEETRAVELTLNTDGREATGRSDPPTFDVAFVSPNGTVVEAERTTVTKNGYVNLAGRGESSDDSVYATGGTERTFTYRLENPTEGEWTVRIMPHNAIRFSYEVVRDES